MKRTILYNICTLSYIAAKLTNYLRSRLRLLQFSDLNSATLRFERIAKRFRASVLDYCTISVHSDTTVFLSITLLVHLDIITVRFCEVYTKCTETFVICSVQWFDGSLLYSSFHIILTLWKYNEVRTVVLERSVISRNIPLRITQTTDGLLSDILKFMLNCMIWVLYGSIYWNQRINYDSSYEQAT